MFLAETVTDSHWAAVLGALGTVILAVGGIVAGFLRAQNVTNKVFADTITKVNDRNLEHLTKLSNESAERSQAMKECITDSNKLIGRAVGVLERHERLLDEYKQQTIQRSNT